METCDCARMHWKGKLLPEDKDRIVTLSAFKVIMRKARDGNFLYVEYVMDGKLSWTFVRMDHITEVTAGYSPSKRCSWFYLSFANGQEIKSIYNFTKEEGGEAAHWFRKFLRKHGNCLEKEIRKLRKVIETQPYGLVEQQVRIALESYDLGIRREDIVKPADKPATNDDVAR